MTTNHSHANSSKRLHGTTYHRKDGAEVKRCSCCDGTCKGCWLCEDDESRLTGHSCVACNGTGWIGGEPAFEVYSYPWNDDKHHFGWTSTGWAFSDAPTTGNNGFLTRNVAVDAAVEALD